MPLRSSKDNLIRIEGDIVYIDLWKDNKIAKISIEDIDLVLEYRWSVAKSNQGWYSLATSRKDGKELDCRWMHRLITNAPDGMDVDHKNHDTLDNTRDNLSVVTHQINGFNRAGANSNSSTGVRGVYLQCTLSTSGKECWFYGARIMVNGKSFTDNNFNFDINIEGDKERAFEAVCKRVEEMRKDHMDNAIPLPERTNGTGVECVYTYKTRVGKEIRYVAKVKINGKVITKNGIPYTPEGLEQARLWVQEIRQKQ